MKQQEKIDQYLNNSMNGQERRLFEAEMAADAELAEAVEFQRELGQFFEDYEPELEATLSTLGAQHFVDLPVEKTEEILSKKLSKWKWGLPLLLVLGLAIGWLMWYEEVQKPVTTNEVIAPPSPEIQEIPSNTSTSTADTLQTTVPASSEPTEVIPDLSPPSTPKAVPAPIAMLDEAVFRPNPLLESLMNEQVRNEDPNFNVILPAEDAVFDHQPNVLFILEGTTSIEPPYELIIFSNRSFDFENDYPLLRQSFSGQIDRDEYRFLFQANIPFAQGLYYWIVQDGVGMIQYVSKFQVR